MTSVLDIFDDVPSRDDRKLLERWHSEVQRSLRSQRSEWMAAADAGALDRDAGWWLLSWVEDAASEVASGAPAELVVDAAFAMSLLEASPLDRRDVLTVAALLRRAASMASADYAGAVRAGCQAAGALGEAIEPWLLKASEALPLTYEQVVSGDVIVFRRTQSEVGMTEEEALRWLGEEPLSGVEGRATPGRGTPMAGDVKPWPTWVRYPLIAAFAVMVVIGLVLATTSGIQAATVRVIIAGVLIPAVLAPLQLWGVRRRARRASRTRR